MEILLLLIAGVVVYFLYNTLQDYLKNPINQQSYPKQLEDTNINFQNAYEQVSVVEKAKSNEISVLAANLGNFIVWSKMKTCPLEKELLDGILTDMASESKNPKLSKEELSKIVMEQKNHDTTIQIDELCEEYVALTKGEYKKRLKVVEFLFALAYADGVLSEDEEDCIIDIAAFFELANDDFNALYESFKQIYAQAKTMSEKEATAIFVLQDSKDLNKRDLEQKYHDLIKNAKQNIFDSKNINKTFRDTSLSRIKEIDEAYTLLKPLAQDRRSSQETQGDSQDLENLQNSQVLQDSQKDEKSTTDKPRSSWDF